MIEIATADNKKNCFILISTTTSCISGHGGRVHVETELTLNTG